MIICDKLTRFYGSFIAVDGISLSIPKGAVTALVGPNGAGKSTTIRMLSTLLAPSRGRAIIGGRDVMKDPAGVRRLIGYLPEAFQMYEDLTVSRYLGFFARCYGLDVETGESRTRDFLERLGLMPKANERVGTLSRGMRQRLGVAKSFIHDPEVVFLDEPASGLDPVARTELRDFLRYQQHLGKTVVISSHVLKELADFCDHMAIIQGGKLVEFGRLTGAEGIIAKYSEQAQSGRRYQLRVLKDAPRLELFLAERPEISNLTRQDQGATFQLNGDDEMTAALVTALVEAGFGVTRFAAEEIDLEHVYRKASQGNGGGE